MDVSFPYGQICKLFVYQICGYCNVNIKSRNYSINLKEIYVQNKVDTKRYINTMKYPKRLKFDKYNNNC
jgi:hypothetical protein